MVAHVPQDVTTHLMNHLSLHPTIRTCSSDTILRAIKELTQENTSYTSDTGKNYDFNTADTLNTLLLNCMFASGQLEEGEMYDVDFDHQFIETEKHDAKLAYKKFFGYRPGVAVIGDRCSSLYNDILPKMADSSSRNQPKFLFLEACMHMHTRVPEL